MTMTINAVINQNGAVRLFDRDNKEIATYVPRKGEHVMEFLEFLEGHIPVSREDHVFSSECDEINVTLPGAMPAVHRVLDTIAFASKFGIQLATYIYDPDKVPANLQLMAQFNQPVECVLQNIL